MNAIVAVDLNWGIGCRGQLLAHVSEDLRRFKEMTTGKIVVMGRKTLESLPGGKPLPHRQNVVLSRNPDYNPNGVIVCNSVNEMVQKFGPKEQEYMFVIGGGAIYSKMLPFCKKAYVTCIHEKYEADTYFPNLEQDENWTCIEITPVETASGIQVSYMTFENIKPVLL